MDLSTIAASQTQSASSSAFSSLTENLDTFLTLLTTQLQNQDPLEPLDTEQFTQQLVQFAGVEQSIQTNSNLETLIALQSSSDRSSALELIGRAVTIDTDQATNNGAGAEWSYSVPQAAASVNLSVVDETGATVATAVGINGDQRFQWNGTNDSGDAAPAGLYRLVVDARDAAGAPVTVNVQTESRVRAVSFENDGPRIETDAGLFSLDTVTRASV